MLSYLSVAEDGVALVRAEAFILAHSEHLHTPTGSNTSGSMDWLSSPDVGFIITVCKGLSSNMQGLLGVSHSH